MIQMPQHNLEISAFTGSESIVANGCSSTKRDVAVAGCYLESEILCPRYSCTNLNKFDFKHRQLRDLSRSRSSPPTAAFVLFRYLWQQNQQNIMQ